MGSPVYLLRPQGSLPLVVGAAFVARAAIYGTGTTTVEVKADKRVLYFHLACSSAFLLLAWWNAVASPRVVARSSTHLRLALWLHRWCGRVAALASFLAAFSAAALSFTARHARLPFALWAGLWVVRSNARMYL